MENNNELAKEFAVWCWGKEVSRDVSKIESLFSTFCAEKELKERDFEILKERTSVNIGSDKIEILSAKRLSDGEVFNTDDFVTNGHSSKMRITEFNVVNKELRIFTDNDYSGWNLLKDLTKVKPVLFKTLDGIDIFEGDTIFYIFNDLTPLKNAGYVKKWQVIENKASNGNFGNDYYKVFSTEIAAKNYKTENEKKYSLKDVREAMSGKYFDMGYNSIVRNVVLINLIENGNI